MPPPRALSVLLLAAAALSAMTCRADSDATADDACTASCAQAIAVCNAPCSFNAAAAKAYSAYAQCINASCAPECEDDDGCPLMSSGCESCVQGACATDIATCMSE